MGVPGLLSAVLCYCVGNCTCYFVLLSVLLDASVTVWVTFHVTVSLLHYICCIFLVTVLLSVCYCLRYCLCYLMLMLLSG